MNLAAKILLAAACTATVSLSAAYGQSPEAATSAPAAEAPQTPDGGAPPADVDTPGDADANAPAGLGRLADRSTVATALRWVVLVSVLSLVPAAAILVTSFTRVVVVLGLLRHGLGTAQLPPNTVLTGLAVLVTAAVMAPVFQTVYRQGFEPYAAGEATAAEALSAAERPVRSFMIRQIETAGNQEDVYLFLDERLGGRDDLAWRDVPSMSLVPAFVVSELKQAFAIGFRMLLPFLVVDLLVAAILTSMGMLMLPPVLVSLPLKLLLFVQADGWHRVIGSLVESFR
jgi:flagellar biosynthetic protein FliP